MTITIHYSRLCQFLIENKIVVFPDDHTMVEQELVQIFTAINNGGEQPLSSRKMSYFDLQSFIADLKKNESWFIFLFRVITFGLFASSILSKSIRLLKQWELHNAYLWDGSKRLIEVFSLELHLKERKLNRLQEEHNQLQTRLSEVGRSLTTVITEIKEQCRRWDITLADTSHSHISTFTKQDIIDSIRLKMTADLDVRLELIANSVFESNLSTCLSYADKFAEEMNRSNSSSSNGSSSSSYSHIRKWLLPLQSQHLEPSSKTMEWSLYCSDILLDLCMLKGFLLRRIEESDYVDIFLPSSTNNTVNVSRTTLQSYSTLIERLLVHFKSSWWNQLSPDFYEAEGTAIMQTVERFHTLTLLHKQLEVQSTESNERMQVAQNEYKITKQAGRSTIYMASTLIKTIAFIRSVIL